MTRIDPTKPRFQIWEDEDGLWNWRLVGGNSQMIATGKDYSIKSSAETAVCNTVKAITGHEPQWCGPAKACIGAKKVRKLNPDLFGNLITVQYL